MKLILKLIDASFFCPSQNPSNLVQHEYPAFKDRQNTVGGIFKLYPKIIMGPFLIFEVNMQRKVISMQGKKKVVLTPE